MFTIILTTFFTDAHCLNMKLTKMNVKTRGYNFFLLFLSVMENNYLSTYLWVWLRPMRHTEQVFVLSAQPWHEMCPLWHWRTMLLAGTVRQMGHCRISFIFALKLTSLASASSILRFMESKACCNIEWGYKLILGYLVGWYTIQFRRKGGNKSFSN